MKSFGRSWVVGPFDGLDDGLGLILLLNLLDEGLELIGLGNGTVRIGEGGGGEVGLKIAVKQRAHAGGEDKGSEKILVEAAATDDVDIFVADRLAADGGQRKGNAVGQLLTPEKGAGAVPALDASDPVVFLADAGRILGGGNERGIGIH